jgi:predicted dehydrogenase
MSLIQANQELRFGLVGCGNVVRDLHLPAWSVIPEARLVAICDSSPASLDAVSQRIPDARRYSSFDDFINDSAGLSFVVLATPGVTHPELSQKILDRGINLLCEKPLALNAPDAHRMCALADETGAILTTIHNYRFKENTRQALRALRKRQLGDIVAVNLKFRSGSLFGEQVPWRRDERIHRTLLFDSGIHLVDIAMLFLGPLKSLRFVEADVDSLGIQRVVFGTLHENGARGVFDLMVDASSTSTEIEVLGESAGLALQFFPQGFRMLPVRDNPLYRSFAEGRRLLDFARETIADKLLRRKCSHRARSHADLFSEFVGTLRGKRPNPVPGREVLQTIQLLDEVARRSYGEPEVDAPRKGRAIETAAPPAK